MTHYQCGSCLYESDRLGEAEQHSRQTGHVCIGKDGAGPARGRFGKAGVAVKAGASVLAATTIGVLAWKYKTLQEEHEELQTKHEGLLPMAAGLAVQLAESMAENDYLKSATGAAKTLKSYDS
ncbi:hypothetical protein [Streptomyces goshikiensis]|uniref:hypothetical protein n=1 Tax=Streptomyces goshikiensis TaxID=1942 RepID=UPI0037A00397